MRSFTGIAPVALAALSLSIPTQAEAASDPYFRDWGIECTPGALQACFSLSIGFVYSGNSTTATIRWSNLQGIQGYPDPGAFGWRGVSFFNLHLVGPGGSGLTEQHSTVEGQGWTRGIWTQGGAVPGPPPLFGFNGQDQWALWGCSHPDTVDHVGVHIFGAYTCGGTLVTTYSLGGIWTLTDSSYASLGGSSLAGVGASCNTRSTCVDPVAVTPEPTTIALLATGLLGLAGMARRRRSRAEQVLAREPSTRAP